MRITSPTLHATIVLSIGVFVTVLVISFVFEVEVVARGKGRVVPMSRVQVVQPEYSGRITAIHVRNGASVAEGEVLVELDPTDAISELGTIEVERDRLHIEMARVEAMLDAMNGELLTRDFGDRALAFYIVPQVLASHPFVEEQRRILQANVSDLLASLAQIDARTAANDMSEEVSRAHVSRINAALDIQMVRLRTSEQLFAQGTISRSTFLDVQQAFTGLERERDVYLRELEHKMAERAVLESERRRLITSLRGSLLDRKAQVDSRLATLAEGERAAIRRVDSATLVAPASGIVDQLKVFTVGGVAEAGAELLRIVPYDAPVEIEGTFSNQDIGFMEIGQQAIIRLDAYPSERFGFVQGHVSDIAADSTKVSEDQWGFTVRVTPDHAFLEAGIDRFPLRPGMTATIDVTTGTRRIISYFFAPILRTIQDAMGER
jgi:hemolysin D